MQGGPYGENLAEGYGNATATVEAWGDEGSQYDFSSGDFTEESGHFTELVWKSVTATGCGRKFCNGEGGVPGWYVGSLWRRYCFGVECSMLIMIILGMWSANTILAVIFLGTSRRMYSLVRTRQRVVQRVPYCRQLGEVTTHLSFGHGVCGGLLVLAS